MNTFTLKNGKTISYRRLKQGDEIALAKFNDNLSEQSRALFMPHSYSEETLAKVIKRSEDGNDLVYVAFDDTAEIIAYFFLWWYDSPFPVLGISITDKYHKQGLGSQIMSRLKDDAAEAECDAIELTTELGNKTAFDLYQKAGFKCLGQVDNIAGDGRVTKEWSLYYPIKPNVIPSPRKHCSPVD